MDTNGDRIADLNIDSDGDGICDINCDTNGDGLCDYRCLQAHELGMDYLLVLYRNWYSSRNRNSILNY